MKKVPFSKIKPGKFHKMPGLKGLWQKCSGNCGETQCVKGPEIGAVDACDPDTLVTPVNATIVVG